MAKENESGTEKTEEPTAKRKNKIRNEGNVPVSKELNSTAILIAGIIVLTVWGSDLKSNLAYYMRVTFEESYHINITMETVYAYFSLGIIEIVKMLLPMLLVFMFTGVYIHLVQFGFRFTTKPLKPKFAQVLNLVKGLKKVFISLSALANLLRSLIKLLIIGYIGYLTVSEQIDSFIPLIEKTVEEIFAHTADAVMLLLIRITALLLLFATVDVIYTRWKFNRDNKMTKQEVEDEVKDRDIDPKIKQQIRKRQVEIVMKSMMEAVPKADVIITNPIHVAVAISYNQSKNSSPVVVAKGLRLIADKIKKIATENEIPIVESPPLARSLYKKVDVGQELPEEFFKAVAEILAFVYKMNEKAS